jgi:hypothetical protein
VTGLVETIVVVRARGFVDLAAVGVERCFTALDAGPGELPCDESADAVGAPSATPAPTPSAMASPPT